MPISWNEIRSRAVSFSKQWAGESREQAEAKTFWDEFFKVYGLTRRLLASFEEPVRNLGGSYGFIDLFWKGVLLAEHKSLGKDLGKAHAQAMDYIQDLGREGRGDEVPQYVIVSDFARIALHDLEADTTVEFPLAELHKNIHHFGFIPGYKQHKLEAEDPINIKAVQIMGDLHDALEAGGYSGHELERLLVRVLFCLFAEDTGIFERNAFEFFLQHHTDPDGADLGPQLAQFFQVLNKPKSRRQKNLREELADLPYVNGELFAESLSFAAFNRDMRNRLLACTRFNWSRISPAVFGALFQAVMESRERRQIGAHYTSERDILKLIRPLFLDDLRSKLKQAGRDRKELRKLHDRIASMRLLDPACGCGNFLVVAYRELRQLEIELLQSFYHGDEQSLLDIRTLSRVDVDQMYGIEIEEWPVRIAEVAMWLMDHQMNLRLSEAFGQYYSRLPLRQSPHIRHGNALRTDWNEVLPASECTHVLGNPPFVGKKARSADQKADMKHIWGDIKSSGILDYVTCWYRKAAAYFAGSNVTAAFVSTNSISQGEQVGILWSDLFLNFQLNIHFAHRTFAWESEARGKAHVHVVIVGFGAAERKNKLLFDYESITGDPVLQRVSNISPYLVEGPNIAIKRRSRPICVCQQFRFGNMPNDDGNLLLTAEEARELISKEPRAVPFVRRFMSNWEYLHNVDRYCLWLTSAKPEELKSIGPVLERVQRVRTYREASKRETTRKLAAFPYLFGEIRQPESNYVLMPRHSSQGRKYIPISYFGPECIVADSCLALGDASHFDFGVLSSEMHMSWVRHVAGRIKSDYRYSVELVYNNYPWPQDVTEKQRHGVEDAAQQVLDVRERYPDSSLADLYDPLSMPADLTKAHAKLDRAVDRAYRSQPFPNERNRIEYLFKSYQQLTAPLLPAKTVRRRRSSHR